jgi:hypothetical protein
MNSKLTTRKSTETRAKNKYSYVHMHSRRYGSLSETEASKIMTTAVSALHNASDGEVSY